MSAITQASTMDRWYILGLSSVSEVEVGVQHIIADIIAKDHRTMEFIRNM